MSKPRARSSEWVKPEALTPWDHNPRVNDHAVAEVAESIKRFGWGSPILVRAEDKVVIAGHTRLKAAELLGLDKVLVRYMDLDPAQAKALALADNKLGERASWDDELLATVLRELDAEDIDLDGLGWDEDDLHDLIGPGDEGMGGDDVEPEPLPEVPVSKVGEVYELGPHRLICGDCTDRGVWDALLGDERVDMLLTDPPYCSGGFQESGKAAGSVGTRGDVMIARDTLSTRGYQALMRRVLNVAPTGILYAFTDWRMWSSLFDVAEAAGFGVRNMIVWDKGSPGMGVGWRMQHELILVGIKVKSPFDRHKAQGNVIQAQRTGNVNHATEKPVDLLAKVIGVNDAAKSVADPFAGSGSTLIACAQTGRVARCIELDPRYCDVIRRRWTRYATEQGIDPGPGALGDDE